MRQATASMGGMTWERLEEEDILTLSLLKEGDPGQEVIFTDGFPTDNKRGRFVPADYIKTDELPDDQYPFIFTTGRQLQHWHAWSMTCRSTILDVIEPVPMFSIHLLDLQSININPGEPVQIESKRGTIVAIAREDKGMQQGCIFMAFCYREAAANLLTNEALDPFGKIPEFKFCAVTLAAVENTINS